MLGVILLTLIALMIVRIVESNLRKRGRKSFRFRFSLASILGAMTALCIVLALGKLGLITVDRSWRYAVIPVFLTLMVLRFGSTSVFATLIAGIGGFVVGHDLPVALAFEPLLGTAGKYVFPLPLTTGEVILLYAGGPMFIAAFLSMVAEAASYQIICHQLAKREDVIQSSSRT